MDYSFLLTQLRRGPQRVRALAAGLSPRQARFKPDPDSWSILEVVNHLVDEEIHDFRSHLDFILSPRGKEWEPIDPGAWVTERKYNERDLEESLENFARERAKSLAWLDSLGEVDWDTVYTSEYGSMRAGDMLAAWAAHDGLHLRQLVELLRVVTEQAAGNYDVSYAGEW